MQLAELPATLLDYYTHNDGSWRCVEAVLQNLLSTPNVQAIVANYRDVTESRQAEEALRESEKKYRDLVDNALVGVYRTNLKGEIFYVNEALSKMFEFESPGEMISTGVLTRYKNPRDREVLLEDLRRAGKVNNFEIQVVTETGKTKTVLLSATLEGDILSGMIRDITERKRAEEALSQGREWLNAIFEASRDGIVVEENEVIVYTNKSFASLFGYDSPEELIDEHVSIVQSDEYNQQMLEFGRKRLRGEPVPTVYEFKGRRKDGTLIELEASVSTFTIDSKEYLITLVRNITERKRAQEALALERNLLRTLIDNLPDYIFVKDIESRFIVANTAVMGLLGATTSDEVVGKKDSDFFPEELAARYFTDEQTIIRSGQPQIGREEPVIDQAGNRRWVLSTKMPLRDSQGNIVGIVGLNRDITERKQLEQQLLQAQKMESLGTLAGGIAHDFNNILAIILGYTSLLEGEKIDPTRTSKSIGAISKAVQRGTSLVRQLLTFARKADALIESVRLNDTIGELANLLKDTFPKTIQVSLQLHEHIPSIVGDVNQLHQALLNLSVNALDAMPRGGTLTLSTGTVIGADLQNRFPEAREDQYVCIGVADTGIGMDELTRSRIFEPFFTTKEKGRGTGLGLAVVYGIVTGHHGFIDAESQLGRGATFHLYLPVQSHFVESSTVLAIGDTSEVTGGTETVLVVEDEQMLLDLLSNLLAGIGYKVLTARDGLEAVEVYRQHKREIALVLMDMGLPKLGGWETYLRIRENNPKAKVVIASGFVEPNLKSEILKAGAKDFVQKPYIPKEVLRRVRRAIDQSEK